jgi:hypothetical protein
MLFGAHQAAPSRLNQNGQCCGSSIVIHRKSVNSAIAVLPPPGGAGLRLENAEFLFEQIAYGLISTSG